MTRQITGKAMMLDEIINYVQSLQRQIEVSVSKTYGFGGLLYGLFRPMAESSLSCLRWTFQFLSMKLSAIGPGLNCDLDLQDVRLQSSTRVEKENAFRLIFRQSLSLQILCTQDASSAFPGYNLQTSNVHINLYRASEEGFSHRNRIIPSPANVHVTRNAQLSAFPQVFIRRP
jgi:hypothetical protein